MSKTRDLRTYRVVLTITQDDSEYGPLADWDWAHILDPDGVPWFLHRLDSVEAVPLDPEQADALAKYESGE